MTVYFSCISEKLINGMMEVQDPDPILIASIADTDEVMANNLETVDWPGATTDRGPSGRCVYRGYLLAETRLLDGKTAASTGDLPAIFKLG